METARYRPLLSFYRICQLLLAGTCTWSGTPLACDSVQSPTRPPARVFPGTVIAAWEDVLPWLERSHLETGLALEETGSSGKRPALPLLLQGSSFLSVIAGLPRRVPERMLISQASLMVPTRIPAIHPPRPWKGA